MGVQLDRATAVRKRRSIGAASDRGTWVRIEARPLTKMYGQGHGVAEAAALRGIAKPGWRGGLSWGEPLGLVWRADETDLIVDAPIKPGGILTAPPELSEEWWARLGASLDALAGACTTRVATVHTVPMTQGRLTNTITGVVGDQLDTTILEWTPAHADLNWANLTAPRCWVLDWEDWGMAPRGLDAAGLWVASLAVPALAARIARERHADLSGRSGKLAALYWCCELLAVPGYGGPLEAPAAREAERLAAMLELSRAR